MCICGGESGCGLQDYACEAGVGGLGLLNGRGVIGEDVRLSVAEQGRRHAENPSSKA